MLAPQSNPRAADKMIFRKIGPILLIKVGDTEQIKLRFQLNRPGNEGTWSQTRSNTKAPRIYVCIKQSAHLLKSSDLNKEPVKIAFILQFKICAESE